MQNALIDDPSAASGLAGETFLLELLAGKRGNRQRAGDGRCRGTRWRNCCSPARRHGRATGQEALHRYQSVPTPDGLTAIMKPLLVAWALKGEGHTNAALSTLQVQAGSPGLRTVFALHIALIADQAGLVPTAAQNYGIVQGSLQAPNLRLAQLLASWDARTGDTVGAGQVLDSLTPDMAMAMTVPALKKRVMTTPVPTAVDGLAEVYLNLAAAFEDEANNSVQPGARARGQQTVLILLQLALHLRPDLTEARLLLSDVIDTGQNASVALAPLQAIRAADPLYPLAVLRSAVLLARLGQTDKARQQARGFGGGLSPERGAAAGARRSAAGQIALYADASAAYTKALALMPPNNPATWLVYYDRGISYDQGGNWAKRAAGFCRPR